LHQGKTKAITLTLALQPNDRASADDEQPNASTSLSHFGLMLVPANAVVGSGESGLAVMNVDPNSPAADHGFQTGEVILDVGGKSVTSGDDMRRALAEVRARGKHNILMLAKRANTTRFIPLPLR
jgi:serine protease Do